MPFIYGSMVAQSLDGHWEVRTVPPVLEFLNHLARLDIKLWVEGGELRFKAPRGALTPDLRSRLKEHKGEVLRFLSETATTTKPKAALVPVPRDSPPPLSFTQRRIWFIDKLRPGHPVYHVPFAYDVEGCPSPKDLETALAEIIRRHESLRTRFLEIDGQAVQHIEPPWQPTLGIWDLSALDAPTASRIREALLIAAGALPFALDRLPLLRLTLLQGPNGMATMYLVVHHIIWDEWSMNVFMDDFHRIYAGLLHHSYRPLPPAEIQFADYAVWQREWMRQGGLERGLAFWRRFLEGAPPNTELPTDRPRPTYAGHRGALWSFEISRATTRAIKALGPPRGVTLFMTVLAALKMLVSRYSGQDDVLIGTPIANRDQPGVESIIGFFANTLVLRGNLSGDPSFTQWLERTRASTLKAFAHQDMPFENLVEALCTDRDLSRNPFFQIMFSFHNEPAGVTRLGNLNLVPHIFDAQLTHFDLTVGLVEYEDILAGGVGYDTDLFDATTIRRLVDHFTHLLAEAAAKPDRPLSRLAYMPDGERHLLLSEWNDTEQLLPGSFSFQKAFQSWAARTSQRVALGSHDQVWTYLAFNRRANRLARMLRTRGTRPHGLVGICLERGPDMVMALMAVLKTGAAYVPLDPTDAPERLCRILEDSGIVLLITRRNLWARANGPDTLFLEDLRSHLNRGTARNPKPPPGAPDHLVYVLFTSGSTGRPKGVAVAHRQLDHYLTAVRFRLNIGDGWRYALVSTFAADLGNTTLFPALATGGTLHVLDRDTCLNAHQLGTYFERRVVDFLKIVPTHLAHLLMLNPSAAVLPRKILVLGGEACDPKLVAKVRHLAPGLWVFNHYGPSETTVGVTALRLKPNTPHRYGAYTLGRSLANLRLHVVNTRLQLAPVGVPGELAIAGAGLARGYLARAQLTAVGFVPDPFGRTAGARLYRTGDLVRLLADGLPLFLGRIDHQVKIRGFRVEPSEVENILKTMPDLRDAYVHVGQEPGGERCLIAYAVSRSGSRDELGVRAYLQERLPEHMIPAATMFLDALPLTPNGKIDRKALPEPGWGLAEGTFTVPETPTEQKLAEIWAGLLPVDRVGLHDHFFRIGGHSLLAAQVVARVRSVFGVELPIRAIFEKPTLAAQAHAIDQLRTDHAHPAPPPILPVDRNRDLPLSFAQQRLWFIDQLEPGNPAYNVPRAIRIRGCFDPVAFQRALATLGARHESLRTTFRERDGNPVQIIDTHFEPALILVDLRRQREDSASRTAADLASREALIPFDLARGPLFRCTVLALNRGEHILFLNMHHIISDLWSAGVLIRELALGYRAGLRGRRLVLPPLPIQYADFAVWQRAWLRDRTLESQLTYWRRQLAGEPPELILPTDRPRPRLQSYRGGVCWFSLDESVGQGLRHLAHERDATLFMTALAGFAALLGRYSGQEDLWIGSPIANRERAEIQDLIGFFSNTLVLRGNLEGQPSFCQLLSRFRQTALQAFAHGDLPFEKLVEALQPDRDLSRNPLFQVMLVFQKQSTLPPGAGELDWTFYEVERRTTHFDLMFIVSERLEGSTESDGLDAGFEFNANLFDKTTILRMARHFKILWRAIVSEPDRSIAELALLTPHERNQVLLAWNDTRDAETTPSMLNTVRERSRRAPHAVAIQFHDTLGTSHFLTYRRLDDHTGRLACQLQKEGVEPDIPVAIHLERSPAMAIAVLAILKAGGAYLPIDPAYPTERKAIILADATPAQVLTTPSLAQSLPQETPVWYFPPVPKGETRAQPLLQDESNRLAYLIYTSGSTGVPKGVAMRMGPLANLMAWQCSQPTFLPRARTLQFASLSFDVAFQELFSTWCSGGVLLMTSETLRRDTETLAGLLQAVRAQRLFLPYVGLQQLAAVVGEGAPLPDAVREIITAGEQLRLTRPILAFLARLHGCRLHNHYGPSESHVATAHALPPKPDADGFAAPIGRPVMHTRIYILDRHEQLLPIGIAGELFIGGAPLARGYLRRPALTGSRFLPDPFSTQPGARRYRSGDVARWFPDGKLAFLGRIDHQVKLRGFRVELGEIETQLERHPGVGHVAVLLRNDPAGNRRLVAFLQPRDQQGEAADTASLGTDLRRELASRLPEFMVPAAFVFLDDMPLTRSGKVDRVTLARMAVDQANLAATATSSHDTSHAAPRGKLEQAIAAIWHEVLHVNPGAHDDFFRLGGHSLLATQVVSRLRKKFGQPFPLRLIFECPTVTALADAIWESIWSAYRVRETSVDRGPERADTPKLPTQGEEPIWPINRNGDPPLSFSQQRLWFFDRLSPGAIPFNIPLALSLKGPFHPLAFSQALNLLTGRHESLRTTFAQVDERVLQRIHPTQAPCLSWVDLQGLENRADRLCKDLVAGELRIPFDLVAGPVWRCALLRLGPQSHVMLLTFHHIVTDGWSLTVFVREFKLAYEAACLGKTSSLSPLPIQYADFAIWQRRLDFGPQLAYWRDRLDDLPPAMPTELPRSETPGGVGRRLRFAVREGTALGLEALSRRENATLFMALLTAWKALLAGFSGMEDMVVGTTVANRNCTEFEGLLGFFVNTLVLRTNLSNTARFLEVLRAVRDVVMGALVHQDLPFDQLVEALNPHRAPNRHPIFQTLFTYQNLPNTEIRLAGLSLENIEADEGPTVFDLSLAMTRVPSGLLGTLVFRTDLFTIGTAKAMVKHLVSLCEVMATDPQTALADHAFLDESERKRLAWPTEPRETTGSPLPAAVSGKVLQAGAMAIGRPVGNVGVYLVDGGMNLMPFGCEGELWLGGLGLARGFLGQPELTAQYFVADPFSGRVGARLYRSGDLAIWREGALHYRGRVDHQVKIRGFRLELGEIEARLAEHPDVREAVVLVDKSTGLHRLLAHVAVSADSPDPQHGRRIRAYLEGHLPEFMIPQTIFVHARLPKTSSGKFDRPALARHLSQSVDDKLQTPPRDGVEWELARIWRDLLGMEAIGIHDNFFELGGHSLLTLRLMGRIHKRFGVNLPVATLFTQPTIASLAARVASCPGAVSHSLVTIKDGEGARPLFLVHPVGGNVLAYAELARHLEGPIYGFESPGLEPGREPVADIDRLAAMYMREMRRAQPRGPYALAGWSLGGILAMEMVRQLRDAGEEMGLFALLDSWLQITAIDANDDEMVLRFAQDLAAISGKALPFDWEAPPGLDAGERLDLLWHTCLELGVFTPDFGQDRLARLFAVFCANMRAVRGYRPRPYDGPVVIFQARELLPGQRDSEKAAAAWSRQGISGEVIDVPGHHYSMLAAPHAAVLAYHLRERLRPAAGENTPQLVSNLS